MKGVLAAFDETRRQLMDELDVLAKRGQNLMQQVANKFGVHGMQVQAMKDFVNQITQYQIDEGKYSDPQLQQLVAAKTDELADFEAAYNVSSAPTGGGIVPVRAGAGLGFVAALGGLGLLVWLGTRKKNGRKKKRK
jgi:hypothetical protein